MGFFTIVLGIPMKFLGIFYHTIFRKSNGFKDSLENLYLKSYNLTKGAKIEVLNGKIYLNCFTVGKLLSKANAHNLSDQQILDLLCQLQLLSMSFMRYERDGESVSMIMSKFKTTSGMEVSKHFTYREGNSLMHSTSNTNFRLDVNQKVDIALPSLVKAGALNPGTVITKGYQNLTPYNLYRKISIFEVNALKFGHLDTFKLDKDSYQYLYNKDADYRNLLSVYLKGNGIDEILVKELVANCYTLALENLSDGDLIREVQNYRDSID